MLILHNISYLYPGMDTLFSNINLSLNGNDKVALVGNNGSGKSTLLKIIAQQLQPTAGQVQTTSEPYLVPQIFGQFDHLSVAQALRIEVKLNALKEILEGNVTEENLALLGDDWTIEERCHEAMQYWQLNNIALSQKLSSLSGGQKTKVFLAGISLHRPQLVLLDEPSNHLDDTARKLLYNFINTTQATLFVVSHDRQLLNLMNTVCELHRNGIAVYGGNYDFYAEQKTVENNALSNDIQAKERELRKAKEKERETLERQQKLDARGKKKQSKSGVARIMMNTLKNNAENSTSKLKSAHAEKINGIHEGLRELRSSLPGIDKMRMGLNDSSLHRGKILFMVKDVNFNYGNDILWKEHLNFIITSGERIAFKGDNGSGKTTLLKLLLGKVEPTCGSIENAAGISVYIDQDYSLIDNSLSVYAQAMQFNNSGLQEHEIKIKLHSFLFLKDDWNKPCGALSGGERMRLLLCCLTLNNHMSDLMVLDEPTNNLDIQNLEILTQAIRKYNGTLLVVSHDELFLEQINVERRIVLA
ncbi:ATP-binding cassette domain-containing protein [Flavobacterium sp. Sd200]|uniref:ATP-binding cassette domain-containing protein n=1 Tax=Flavobacterium sp. Sd200 TaxID=2692211 RepID=UPI00137087BD|nr:ATP-binding cassette domain-containing protein [Flavobacterium sp. Sd200]MXN89668.1 ATP-binding cassette domain-containing protein [Flavobacterium sp. Sd200]